MAGFQIGAKQIVLACGLAAAGGGVMYYGNQALPEPPKAKDAPPPPVQPSLMTAVGFEVSGSESFQTLAKEAVKKGKPVKAGKITYYRWSPGQGIELWAFRPPHQKLLKLTPHFAGPGRSRVHVLKTIQGVSASQAIGGFLGTVNVKVAKGVVNAQEVFFDSPTYLKDRPKSLPCSASLQMAAFVKSVAVIYPSGADYLAAHKDRVALEPGTWNPGGLYTPQGDLAPHPKPEGQMAGIIQEARVLTNPFSRRDFVWLRVKGLGGSVDVVADPRQLDGKPVKGGIIEGTFSLSGRLNPTPFKGLAAKVERSTKKPAAAKASH